MYVRVREALKSHNKGKDIKGADNEEESKGVIGKGYAVEAAEAHNSVINHAFFGEIEENETHQATHQVEQTSSCQFPEPSSCSLEEEQALPNSALTSCQENVVCSDARDC